MSQSDQTVCRPCQRHGQDEAHIRVSHRNWWRDFADATRAAHDAEAARWREAADQLEAKIVERDKRIAEMRLVALRGYEQTPLGGIRAWLQEGIVLDAESKMRGAYRARDKVMGTIWRLDRLHHEGKDVDSCSCGKRSQQCREFQALAPMVETLERWESKQVEFLRRELPHFLPNEHPEVAKRRSSRGWVA
jgi:hypothetical protein